MPSKQHVWQDDVAMVGAWCGWQWVGLCQWKQDMGRLLTFLWPSLLTHFSGIIVCCHHFCCRQQWWLVSQLSDVVACLGGTITCHVVSATWHWGGGCSLGFCGWRHGIVVSFLLWLVCRWQQLCGALSVGTRYGGVVTFWWPSLLAHFPGIVVCCCCCCLWHHGIVVVEAGVIGVCCGGGCVQSNNGCGWWLSVVMMTLSMMVVENGCCVSINKVTDY